jgi:hypothetical protein
MVGDDQSLEFELEPTSNGDGKSEPGEKFAQSDGAKIGDFRINLQREH